MTAHDVLLEEILEQPEVLRRQLDARDEIEAIAAALRKRGCETVRFAAHGSSDNAATYGVYAFGLLAGLPAARDSLSLPVYYRARLPLHRTAAIAISQSGRTPDVVEYTRAARADGAATVAITDNPSSPLGEAAEFVLQLHAGDERSVAATKTYTASLAALALLAGSLGGQLDAIAGALAVLAASMPGAVAAHRRDACAVAALLERHDRLFVVGRGPHYATAREIALKVTETAQLLGTAYTATDLLHGPIAALERPFPVWAIAGQDAADVAVKAALTRARDAGAPTILTAPVGTCLSADHHLSTPPAPSPILAPLLSVLSGQLVAHATANLRGLNPDQPSDLISKVTLAA